MSRLNFPYVEWRQTIHSNNGTITIMVGRKRKSRAARYPGGQVVREKQLTKLQIAQRMPHRRGLPDDLIEHERAESQFGRLSLTRKPGSGDEFVISPEQYQAGVQWRKTVMSYRAVLHSPTEFPRSIAGALMGGGGGGDRFMSDEEAIRRKSAYDEAFEAVEERAGRHCMITLNDATIHERYVEPYRLDQLRAALDVLVSIAYQARKRVA